MRLRHGKVPGSLVDVNEITVNCQSKCYRHEQQDPHDTFHSVLPPLFSVAVLDVTSPERRTDLIRAAFSPLLKVTLPSR